MKIYNKVILNIFVCFLFSNVFGQSDSVWNVLVLKKGEQPVFKENMALFSKTGFYLYRNCFYDLKFKNKTKKTLRLVEIKSDSLVFIGISSKKDTDPTIVSKDTFCVNFRDISTLLLLRDWGTGSCKKINIEEYDIVFFKSKQANYIESKKAFVFSSFESELIARISLYGITYFYEYGGELFYHSGINVKVPKYSDEERAKTINVVMTALNLLVNKRIEVKVVIPQKEANK